MINDKASFFKDSIYPITLTYFPQPPTPSEELDQKSYSHLVCPDSSKYSESAGPPAFIAKLSSRIGPRDTGSQAAVAQADCKPGECDCLAKRLTAALLNSRFPLGFLAWFWNPPKDRQTTKLYQELVNGVHSSLVSHW